MESWLGVRGVNIIRRHFCTWCDGCEWSRDPFLPSSTALKTWMRLTWNKEVEKSNFISLEIYFSDGTHSDIYLPHGSASKSLVLETIITGFCNCLLCVWNKITGNYGQINHLKIEFFYYTERRTKWSSIWYINKIFISITIPETNIQKQRPFHGDLSSVNQMFNMTTITSGSFFSTNCDAVHYSTAHILSYLVAGLNDYCSQFHYCARLLRENLFLKESQKKVVTWV
jgi:hypothetical protein